MPDFAGLRVCYAGNGLSEFPEIRRVKIADKRCDRLLFGDVGSIGSGGNSGFQALNLAVQFGARRIILVGFDMSSRSGVHWYGRNNWSMANNPGDDNFRRWIAAFATAAAQLAEAGIEVINASLDSAMKSFPRRSISDALQGWA